MNTILDIKKDNYKKDFYYLLENYDLWIWDFDLTLTKIHTYKQKLDSYNVGRKKQRDLENDFWEPYFFINFVNYLILNDKKVAIISFGSYDVIKTYLDRLFGNNYIFNSKNILTPLSGDSRYGEHIPHPPNDKNQMIINLSKFYHIDLSRIIFFDDTLHNIYQSKQLGIMSVHIPREHGFTSSYLKEIEKQFHKLLEEGKIISSPSSTKKKNIDSTFSHSATHFTNELLLPDFRDDLEKPNTNNIYNFEKSEKIGIEGINLPFENENENESSLTYKLDNKHFIEGFQNHQNIDNYWLSLQYIIEISAIVIICWFLYNKYLS